MNGILRFARSSETPQQDTWSTVMFPRFVSLDTSLHGPGDVSCLPPRVLIWTGRKNKTAFDLSTWLNNHLPKKSQNLSWESFLSSCFEWEPERTGATPVSAVHRCCRYRLCRELWLRTCDRRLRRDGGGYACPFGRTAGPASVVCQYSRLRFDWTWKRKVPMFLQIYKRLLRPCCRYAKSA
jgi:hypothetical protein